MEKITYTRKDAIRIIKATMLPLGELSCPMSGKHKAPYINKEYQLTGIELELDGHITFESDNPDTFGITPTITNNETELSTETLVKIAKWLDDNEEFLYRENGYID